MVFTFIPVLVNLLVNVNNISLLQRKFPVNNTSTPIRTLLENRHVLSPPSNPRSASALLIQIMLHPKWKLHVENRMCRDSLALWASCQKSWPMRALLTTHHPAAMGSSSSKRYHWLPSMLDMGSSAQFLFWNRSCHKCLPKRYMILMVASLLIRWTHPHMPMLILQWLRFWSTDFTWAND